MSKRAKIFIMSMKNSPRLVILKKRLNEIGIVQFRIFYGNDGSTKKKRNIVYSLYDKKKVEYNLGRKMTFNEIRKFGDHSILKFDINKHKFLEYFQELYTFFKRGSVFRG